MIGHRAIGQVERVEVDTAPSDNLNRRYCGQWPRPIGRKLNRRRRVSRPHPAKIIAVPVHIEVEPAARAEFKQFEPWPEAARNFEHPRPEHARSRDFIGLRRAFKP